MIQHDIKLSCFIEFEDKDAFMYININKEDAFSMTLEYANITEKLNDLLNINEQFKIYDSTEDIIIDLENGFMDRFLGQSKMNNKLDLLINLRMKVNHSNGTCDNDCILCNPDFGDDPFPDFIFDLRTSDIENDDPN